MESYTTDAVVLAKRDIREADRQYTLYTKERGKVRALGIGTRRLSSKLAGHLEVGSHTRVTVVMGRRFDRLIGATRTGGDATASPQLLEFCHVLDALTKDAEPDQHVFDVARVAADTAYAAQLHALWLPYVSFAAIAALGLAPSTEVSGSTGKVLPVDRVAFSYTTGTFEELATGSAAQSEEVIHIHPDVFICLHRIATEPWSLVSDVLPSMGVQRGVLQVVDALVARHAHAPVFSHRG